MVPDNSHHVKDVKLIVGYCYIYNVMKRIKSRGRAGIIAFAYCLLVTSRLFVILRYKIYYYIRCWNLGVGLDTVNYKSAFLEVVVCPTGRKKKITQLQKIQYDNLEQRFLNSLDCGEPYTERFVYLTEFPIVDSCAVFSNEQRCDQKDTVYLFYKFLEQVFVARWPVDCRLFLCGTNAIARGKDRRETLYDFSLFVTAYLPVLHLVRISLCPI